MPIPADRPAEPASRVQSLVLSLFAIAGSRAGDIMVKSARPDLRLRAPSLGCAFETRLRTGGDDGHPIASRLPGIVARHAEWRYWLPPAT